MIFDIDFLKFFAANVSDKTKLVMVPQGTKVWRAAKFELRWGKTEPERTNTSINYVDIKLSHFFGIVAGYDKELDLFVWWKP